VNFSNADRPVRLGGLFLRLLLLCCQLAGTARMFKNSTVLPSARSDGDVLMDKILKTHCPKLTQLQRAAVIQYAVERAELKESETAEAIMRLTRRHGSKTAKTTKP
jgi:hypothetical protein